MDVVELIQQIRNLSEKKSARYPNGRGTYKRGKNNPRKSRVRIFPTIKVGLKNLKAGDKFSTEGAGRIYVVTQDGWGKDNEQRVSGRTAKGFTPGSSTPDSHWSSIDAHAKRTKKKHLGTKISEGR